MIGGIEDNDIFGTFFRCEGDDILDEISVRIDDTETVPVPKVLTGKISDKYRLTSTGLTDDIVVTTAIFLGEIDGYLVVAVFVPAHKDSVGIDGKSG